MDYFLLRKGDKPKLDLQEAKNLKDLLEISANDNKGEMSIGAIVKSNKGNVFNNCTFNFQGSNSTQNQIEREIEELKAIQPTGNLFTHQLMTIYQMRSDKSTQIGSKAVIEAISHRKVSVVFSSNELKEEILFSDDNPTKKAYWVDVEVLNVNGKLAGYNVTSLHDTIDLSD